jgi:hypothetical protein
MPFISSINTLTAIKKEVIVPGTDWTSPTVAAYKWDGQLLPNGRFGAQIKVAAKSTYHGTSGESSEKKKYMGVMGQAYNGSSHGATYIYVYDITDPNNPFIEHRIKHWDWYNGGGFSTFAINEHYIIVSDISYNNYTGKIWIEKIGNGGSNSSGYQIIVNEWSGIEGTSESDHFGEQIGITETTDGRGDSRFNFAVGAPYEDGTDGVNSGKVYNYTYNGDLRVATLLNKIDNPSTVPKSGQEWRGTGWNDFFGSSAIEMNTTHILIGSRDENDASSSRSGAAHLFNIDGSFIRTYNNPNAFGTGEGDLFGSKVSLTSKYIIASAAYEDQANTPDWSNSSAGKVYIFDINSGSLLHTLDNPNTGVDVPDLPGGDLFGYSIAANETHLIVGAQGYVDYYEIAGGGYEGIGGIVYIYTLQDGVLVETLNNPIGYKNYDFGDTISLDRFGYSLDISDDTLIVGSPGYDFTNTEYPGPYGEFPNMTDSMIDKGAIFIIKPANN